MKKTKIVATIGPASDSEADIEQLINLGVDMFRFNMKHGDIPWHDERLKRVHKVSNKMGKRVATMLDLQGPEVRLHNVPDSLGQVDSGQKIIFTKPSMASEKVLTIDHPEIFPLIDKDQVIFLDDGLIEMVVIKSGKESFEAKVVEGGKIKPRKTVNFPGLHVDFPALIDKDIEHISLASLHHVDYIALSFVRTVNDILMLKEELKKLDLNCHIIAKVEHPDAVNDLEAILKEADGCMVARGDLGLEYSLQSVPVIQKRIIKTCRELGKPVIVATQMLETMITQPMPTRAEVSDVAGAVYDVADAVMLSAESAAGKYPQKAVNIMVKIAEEVERELVPSQLTINWFGSGQTETLVNAAYILAKKEGIKNLSAFVVLTETGRTVRMLARLRPKLPIIALSPSDKTADQLKLVWGVEPYMFDYVSKKSLDFDSILKYLSDSGLIMLGQQVIMIYGESWGTPGLTSVIRVQGID